MVHIGSRWTPDYIERRDTATGVYECVNSPIESRTEMEVQTALLRPSRPDKLGEWIRAHQARIESEQYQLDAIAEHASEQES